MRPISRQPSLDFFFFPDYSAHAHSKAHEGNMKPNPPAHLCCNFNVLLKLSPSCVPVEKRAQNLTLTHKTSCIASILTIPISLQPLPVVSVAWQRCNNDRIRGQLLRRESMGKLQPAASNSGLFLLSDFASSDDLSSLTMRSYLLSLCRPLASSTGAIFFLFLCHI